jgi:hypothetical protein
MAIDFAGAEKKIRQEYLSKQPSHRGLGDPGHLEFFFSASLTTARSVYYVLSDSGGGTFQKIFSEWYRNLKEQQSFFKAMKDLRDDDVHRASTATESLPKYVEADFGRHESPYYRSAVYNAALFGPRPTIEEQNPDGEKVRAHVLSASASTSSKSGSTLKPAQPAASSSACCVRY